MKKYYLLILLLIFIPKAFSEVYLGKDLAGWPQTEARKVKNDFAVGIT